MKYLHRAHNVETGEVIEFFAKSGGKRIIQLLCDNWNVEELLTPEGYRITALKYLNKGDYFNLVAGRGKQPTHKKSFVRGEYNRTYTKYECCYFEDINHWRLLSGHTLVTIDVTF